MVEAFSAPTNLSQCSQEQISENFEWNNDWKLIWIGGSQTAEPFCLELSVLNQPLWSSNRNKTKPNVSFLGLVVIVCTSLY